MDRRVETRVSRIRESVGLTAAIVALLTGVLLPVLLSTSVGIVTLALGESSDAIVIGVLTVAFAAAAVGTTVVVAVFLGRRARLARAQADLLANVTHELRTPLTAIRMYAQTLEMGRLADDPGRTRECLGVILRETEWLEAAIDRVLTWRRAAKDRASIQPRSGKIQVAVRDAVERFERMIDQDEVALEVELQVPRAIDHDRHAVTQAVLNLLVNAYKYSGQSKRISIVARDFPDRVEVSVEDNGIGLAPVEMTRIFAPFYRVDSRLGSMASGTGLGLAIVRHTALAHHGEVVVESEPGAGSKFTLRLPRAKSQREVVE